MHSPLSRLIAGLIALVALAAVGGQLVLNEAKPHHAGYVAAAWSMAQYFTILTNLLVAYVFGGVALNREQSSGVLAGTLLSIVMVGVVFHVLLAPEIPHQGGEFWTDLGFHLITPIATAVWWLGFARKDIRLGQVPFWLLWPLGYCVYALVRGTLTGSYPYFFFDVDRFGATFVAAYILALVAAFGVAGLGIWLVARLMHRSASRVRV